ncbi:alpha/beta fold hydrolase [Streptomyces monticola]|uniref:Alpha/beta fold hydrolase n=1 Tax=Streptomyces monticola TaxID=2666263 RepID=A0ABW2JEG8_9ACTN
MPTFYAPDGTPLACHLSARASGGSEPPVVCVPGGMQDSVYLGDLGGLGAHRRLALLDLRGTGRSGTPRDAASYRCDRLVDDVEALRAHIGLETMDLLAHSGGANVAVQYAARHPERVGRLALITPSTRAVGIEITGDVRRETVELRRDEPWFAEASAALRSIVAGEATDEHWQAIAPFYYGRWDAAARAHHAAEDEQRNHEALAAFGADGAFDPDTTRSALGRLDAPVLLLAGEVDLAAPPSTTAEFGKLFPNSESAAVVVQPGAGHFPWLDDPGHFAATVGAFLA